MSICFHMSCVEKCFTRFFKTVKKFSMFTHQRQQHLDIHILCMLGESPLLQCFYARAQYSLLSFSVTASTFWVTAVGLATWCNAKILLDACVFASRNWKDSSKLVQKKHSHFRCANVRGLCGSIDSYLLFYYSASLHPIFVSLFHTQSGKALSSTIFNVF